MSLLCSKVPRMRAGYNAAAATSSPTRYRALALAWHMRHKACLSAPQGADSSWNRGCSSGVEHDLAKVGVEGSNPFARSSINWIFRQPHGNSRHPAIHHAPPSRVPRGTSQPRNHSRSVAGNLKSPRRDQRSALTQNLPSRRLQTLAHELFAGPLRRLSRASSAA